MDHDELTLTPTSYIVLGLLQFAGPSTPYALKQGAAGSVGYFWSVPHSQLYAEPARLARAGYVSEEQEPAGRRRKTYALTDKGRAALERWTADPDVPEVELRDPALLKLFFGADPAAMAAGQIARYERLLATYRELREALADQPVARGPVHTLDAGIAHAERSIEFWKTYQPR